MEKSNISESTQKFLDEISSQISVSVFEELETIIARMSNFYKIDIDAHAIPNADPLYKIIELHIKINNTFGAPILNKTSLFYHINLENNAKTLIKELTEIYVKDRYISATEINGMPTSSAHKEWLNTNSTPLNTIPILSDPMPIIISDSFMSKVMDEIKARGDFEISIPRFVDLLFRLDVIIAKEDIQNPNKEE